MEKNIASDPSLDDTSQETAKASKPKPRAKKPKKEKSSPHPFGDKLQEIESFEGASEKIAGYLSFMKKALIAKPFASFGDFWAARTKCLPLFKESLEGVLRSKFWEEFTVLSSEAHHLKAVMEKESAFVQEQLEIAINDIDQNLNHYDKVLNSTPDVIFPMFFDDHINERLSFYQNIQKELNFLSTFAARIHSLRKEILATPMRMRVKNQFFGRLSSFGDQVFPKRRDLVASVSDAFLEDVRAFVENYFKLETNEKIFRLRDEIKALQEAARILSLNSKTFTESRLLLSSCWDTLKEKDKERREELEGKKVQFKENFDAAIKMIDELATEAAKPDAVLDLVEKKEEEVLNWMRSVELSRDDVKHLKASIRDAIRPLLEKAKLEKQKWNEQKKEQDKVRNQKLEDLFAKGEALFDELPSMSSDDINNHIEKLKGDLKDFELSESEEQQKVLLFDRLTDLLLDKRLFEVEEESSPSEKWAELLEDRMAQREEVKHRLESFRKTLGKSGYDFEKAMQLRQLLDEEKMRLEKIDSVIEKIEEKLENPSE